MNHDGSLQLVDFSLLALTFGTLGFIRTSELELESFRQVEVELDGSTLPFSFQRIGKLEVELNVSCRYSDAVDTFGP